MLDNSEALCNSVETKHCDTIFRNRCLFGRVLGSVIYDIVGDLPISRYNIQQNTLCSVQMTNDHCELMCIVNVHSSFVYICTKLFHKDFSNRRTTAICSDRSIEIQMKYFGAHTWCTF